MKRLLHILSTVALTGTLAACGSSESDSTSITMKKESHSSSSSTSSSASVTTAATTTETTSHAVVQSETLEPQAEEPHIAECIVTDMPGPAQMSDESIGYSDDCYWQGLAEKGVVECSGGGYASTISDCTQTFDYGQFPSAPRSDGCVGPAAVCGYYDDAGNPTMEPQ